MPQHFGALTLVLILGMVLIRARMMNWEGLQAIHFGTADKTDFLILPLALLYFYTVFATAFSLSTLSTQ